VALMLPEADAPKKPSKNGHRLVDGLLAAFPKQ
jgi:hypothetical protein